MSQRSKTASVVLISLAAVLICGVMLSLRLRSEIFGFIEREPRFPNKSCPIGKDLSFCATNYATGNGGDMGTLLYGFIFPSNVPYTRTNDEKQTPNKKGIYWLQNSPDGLWVNGRNIDTSKKGSLFVIDSDMNVIRVVLDSKSVAVLATELGSIDPEKVDLKPVWDILKKRPRRRYADE